MEEPSQDSEVALQSLADVFQRLCPAYMVMGMSHEQFWNSNTTAHKAYREAHEMRLRNEEWARWRQGAYVYDALLRVAPVMRAALSKGKVEPGKYPEEPWPLTQEEADEQQQRRERKNFEIFLAQMREESARNRRMRLEAEKRKEAADGV